MVPHKNNGNSLTLPSSNHVSLPVMIFFIFFFGALGSGESDKAASPGPVVIPPMKGVSKLKSRWLSH